MRCTINNFSITYFPNSKWHYHIQCSSLHFGNIQVYSNFLIYFCKCLQLAPILLSKLMEINVEYSPKIRNLCRGAKTSIPNNLEPSNIVPNFNIDVICFPNWCWGCFPRVSKSMLKGPKQLENGVSLVKTSILTLWETQNLLPSALPSPRSAFQGLISKISTLHAIITFSLPLYPWVMHLWSQSGLRWP